MSDEGLRLAQQKMRAAGVDPSAVDVFSHYYRQLEGGDDGKIHVIEKSWFARGSKIIVSGIRRGEVFLGKKYARTPWHLVEKIESVDEDGHVVVRHERAGDEEI